MASRVLVCHSMAAQRNKVHPKRADAPESMGDPAALRIAIRHERRSLGNGRFPFSTLSPAKKFLLSVRRRRGLDGAAATADFGQVESFVVESLVEWAKARSAPCPC